MSLTYKPAPSAAQRMFALAMRFAVVACLLVYGQAAQAQILGKYFPLYFSSFADSTIYKLDSNGNRSVFTSGVNINGAQNMAFDAHGNLYVSSINNNTIVKVNSAGQQSVFTSGLLIAGPRGLAFDKAGNLYVSCFDNNSVVKVDSTGHQTLFAQGGNFTNPRGLVFDAAGNLYVGNSAWSGQIVKISPSGNQTIFASGQGGDGLAFDANGLLWAGSIDDDTLGAFQADGNYAPGGFYFAVIDQFHVWGPEAVAFDYKGNLWSSNYWANSFGVGTVTFSANDPYVGSAAYLNSVTSTTSNPNGLAFSLGYTTTGFASPIVNPPGVNTGNAGRTYPVKWTTTNPDGSLVTSLSAVSSITYKSVTCGSFGNGTSNPLTTTASGSNSLRYDSTANQFVYNWATPTTAGCYDLIVTMDSGQTLTAYFSLN